MLWTQTFPTEQKETVVLCPSEGSSHPQCRGVPCLQRRKTVQLTLCTLPNFQTWLPISVSQPQPQPHPLLSTHIRKAMQFFNQEYLLIHLPGHMQGSLLKSRSRGTLHHIRMWLPGEINCWTLSHPSSAGAWKGSRRGLGCTQPASPKLHPFGSIPACKLNILIILRTSHS